jgi:hypothetical protein
MSLVRGVVVKIRMEMVIDVDPERWANEYGIPAEDVPDDVVSWVTGWVGESYQAELFRGPVRVNRTVT